MVDKEMPFEECPLSEVSFAAGSNWIFRWSRDSQHYVVDLVIKRIEPNGDTTSYLVPEFFMHLIKSFERWERCRIAEQFMEMFRIPGNETSIRK